MPKVKKRNENADKISMRFDIPMLNALIKYITCEFVNNIQISNVNNLFTRVDINDFNYNQDVQVRIKLIKLICEAIITHHIRDVDVMKTFLIPKDQDVADLLNEIDLQKNQLTNSECNSLTDFINERLQFIYIFQVKDDMMKLFEKMNSTAIVSYYEVVNQLKDLMSKLLVNLRTAEASNGLLKEFSFSSPDYAVLMDKIVTKQKRPSAILQTGIRQLNAILSPGFQSGRLYTFLGGTGKFKSGTLLNIADQIRKFNPQIIPVENGMRKTILFVTCENSIEETIIRLYDMYSDVEDDLLTKSTEDVIETLRKEGQFQFTDSEGIDIDLRYFANLEINTADLYSIIRELSDQGKQVIGLILDYISRIRSVANDNGDERLRMSYAAKELKSLAQFFEIPVITAMQINREGNSIIDAAMRDNKQDIAQFIGASSVGNCWNIIEESDWVGLINPELQKSTNTLFLTFKRLKIRGKKDPFAIDYFNHPFVNEKHIRLASDVDKEKPLSVMFLSNDLQSISDKESDAMIKSRPKINATTGSSATNKAVIKSIDLSGITKVA